MFEKQLDDTFFTNEGEAPEEMVEPENVEDDTDMFDEEGAPEVDNELEEPPEYSDTEQEKVEEAAESAESVEDWQAQFGSPQEMYAALQKIQKSYDHLRPKFTQVTQELSNLKKQQDEGQQPQYPEMQQQPFAQPQQMQPDPYGYQQPAAPMGYPPGYDPYQAQQYQQMQGYGQQYPPHMTNQMQAQQPQRQAGQTEKEFADMKRQLATMKIQAEVQALSANPEFAEVAPQLVEVFKAHPKLWEMDNPVQLAYNMVKGQTADKRTQQAIKQGRDSAYKKQETKQDVTTKGRTGKQTPAKSVEDDIADSIVEVAAKRSKSIF